MSNVEYFKSNETYIYRGISGTIYITDKFNPYNAGYKYAVEYSRLSNG